MIKKFYTMLFLLVIISANVYAANSTSFTDLTSKHWAYQAINTMVKDSVVNGYPDSTFKPDKEITKAEFAKIFSIALDVNDDNTGYSTYVEGVSSTHWAYEYIKASIKYFHSSFKFNPDEFITREDAAYALVERINPPINDANALNKFTDANQISSDKVINIRKAVANGIMNGNANGTLNPKGNLTRAEVCTLLYNIKYKLNLSSTSTTLDFGKILKHVEADINLNGPDKNKIVYEFIFDLPDIKNANINVCKGNSFETIPSSITYGVSSNPKFKNLPSVKVSFSTADFYNFRIFFNSIETSDGSSTDKNDFILNYDPFLEIYYEEPIDKDTIFTVKWADFAPHSDGKITWALSNNKKSGNITNNTFSINKDILSSNKLSKEIDVIISAEDKAFYNNNVIEYSYHIYDIKTK